MEKPSPSPVEAGSQLPPQDGSPDTTITATPVAEASQPRVSTASEEKPTVQDEDEDEDEDDEDSDFDELDDVLDNFSKPKPSTSTTNSTTKPASAPSTDDLDEDAFMKQLEQDMASMMSHAARESGATTAEQGKEFQAAIDQGADEFARQLEESGIPPGDFLKQLIADVMAEEEGGEGGGQGKSNKATSSSKEKSDSSVKEKETPESFNEAIQRTIDRMKESGDKATAAAEEDDDDISEDLLAQLLKAVEAGAAGAGDDGDLTKMFMGMMEQLSNKEMLYEPMKELDGKFAPWLEKNRGSGKVPAEDMARYEAQSRVVGLIVAKFEEPGFTDEDQKCREYIWEKMQEMQAQGSPPEELISNPLMEDLKMPGGAPECPQQ
ncbi:hypothetical protein ASPZODRAFT_436595 [Penicilliopsis zonata CBS 506.65]|uniref:Uncharacterized protein n=1 Tax=Penicilliopsis zonata CBS 506.65 TaxID=1073090 RepID=A0A1L9SWQ1_9EURO|nr:hypothetical protein ASPZODRAFT_436595 [Penicilliopsis zonata CBS 506.65]OJJ51625.1 hypothetical protein ASPZODRAFT_436595 [Penicilliopsis zonata CBS 506.65]